MNADVQRGAPGHPADLAGSQHDSARAAGLDRKRQL